VTVPTAAQLVEAVRELLEAEVVPALDGRLAFHARVAANVLAVVERELVLGPAHASALAARLAALGMASEADLAAAIRSGAMDGRWSEVKAAVWATVRDRLAVAHPGYDDG
jgi:Domain of unknown function (DUF6285)